MHEDDEKINFTRANNNGPSKFQVNKFYSFLSFFFFTKPCVKRMDAKT